ncbi:aldehyde dehydrogenase family protein [Agrococcus sp. TF02-05]|uniref:aldehyde dehydrogenase family protein n=1 Tax=Agrococcus sp. TF02-05 TaxID=2815211 RepID=UPI001AA157E3|nr:aldehyde dehydrogenase family protein [Agrococcus sp. TF02-05]MBO1769261.1 aldehyde dehydrogenase family protein [Agrococcus sp. TF02-05]
MASTTITERVRGALTNPATGEPLPERPRLDDAALDALIERAVAAQRTWAAVPVADRADVFLRMASLMRRDARVIAETVTTEIGKPITQSLAEVEKAASALDWYAERAERLLAPDATEVPEAVIEHRPLGVVLAVEPWNFPVWQVLRGGAGILLAGNAQALKPAHTTVGSAEHLERLWSEAGLPAGAFSVLNIASEQTHRLIADDRVAAVTLTGGGAAGAAVAESAGRHLKRVTLELGGNDALIVMPDADLAAAAQAAVDSRYANTGQVCIATKRIILHQQIAEEFLAEFLPRVRSLVVGDPMEPATQIGPLARADIRDDVVDQIERSLEGGATLLLGGTQSDHGRNYVEPTVLGDVRPGVVAFDEEIFGPVVAVVVAESAEEAVALANRSPWGLSASLWTADSAAARAIAAQLEVGSVFVNKGTVSDVRVPIGGVKASGFGRELAEHGVKEFTNPQTVWVVETEGGRR